MNNQRRLFAIAFCGGLLAACSSNDSTPPATNTLSWITCAENAELQCAELTVPMIYDDLRAGTITIGLNKRPANATIKQGSLLFNPGGPGGSGIDLLQSLVAIDTIPAAILDAYDLIGFDPRGIGASTPIDCSEFGVEDVDNYIVDRADIDAFAASATQIAQHCADKHGDYLQHVGSLNVVRDMDSMRQALNEDKLNFIGYSYGTRLAALYLQTYPENSGYIVLDGSLRPESQIIDLAEGAIPAMQRNLESILNQCSRITPQCDGTQLLQRLTERVNALLEQNEQDEFELLGELVLQGAQNPIFGDFLVGPLTAYLVDYDINVLREFLNIFESQTEQDDDSDDDNTYVDIAVLCADDNTRPTAEVLEQKLAQFNGRSDLFAEAYIAQAGSCIGWPEALEPLPPIETRIAPVALVIGGTSDAQTPLQWSEEMATSIGGFFLSSEHQGHTSVFNQQSRCVDTLVTQFLIDGRLPAITSCSSDSAED